MGNNFFRSAHLSVLCLRLLQCVHFIPSVLRTYKSHRNPDIILMNTNQFNLRGLHIAIGNGSWAERSRRMLWLETAKLPQVSVSTRGFPFFWDARLSAAPVYINTGLSPICFIASDVGIQYCAVTMVPSLCVLILEAVLLSAAYAMPTVLYGKWCHWNLWAFGDQAGVLCSRSTYFESLRMFAVFLVCWWY